LSSRVALHSLITGPLQAAAAAAKLALLPDPYAVKAPPAPRKIRMGKSIKSMFNYRTKCEATIRAALGSIMEAIQMHPPDVVAAVLEKLNYEGDETLKLINKALSQSTIPPAILEMVKSMNASSRRHVGKADDAHSGLGCSEALPH
jgi:hypothetical protein